MKIAFFDVTTTISIGGIQTTIWELAKELALKGIEVHVYGGHGPIRPPKLNPSIKIFTFPYISREKIPNFGTRFRRIIERLSMTVFARKSLIKENYDVIVFTKPFDFFVPFILGKNSKTKFAFASGGRDFFLCDRYLSKRIDYWFACSHFNAWQIMAHYKKYPKVVHNGVNSNSFFPKSKDLDLMKSLKINDNEKVFIFAGRLVGWKGVRFIIDAMAHVNVRKLPVRLVIIGDGAEKSNLKKQACTLKVNNRVNFINSVSNSKLCRFYSIADVAIYPSIGDEAFGISIAEAMACSKPVIASFNGGIPEVVGAEEDCGFLIPLASSKDIAEKMVFFANNPNKLKSMGENARQRVIDRFSWKMAAEKLLNTIKEE